MLSFNEMVRFGIVLAQSFALGFQLSKKLSDVPVESVIEVTGTVELRPDGKMNPVGKVIKSVYFYCAVYVKRHQLCRYSDP